MYIIVYVYIYIYTIIYRTHGICQQTGNNYGTCYNRYNSLKRVFDPFQSSNRAATKVQPQYHHQFVSEGLEELRGGVVVHRQNSHVSSSLTRKDSSIRLSRRGALFSGIIYVAMI